MRKIFAGLMLGTLGFSFIGCSTQTNQKIEKPTVQVVEETNKQVETAVVEERVVASSVAAVELLDRLGIEMIGIPTTKYELPDSVKDATPIGNPMKPDMEIIKSLNPTKVIVVNALSPDVAKQIEDLGITLEVLDLSSYKGLKESINHLGSVFNKEDTAHEILQDFESREDKIVEQIKGKEAPEVMVMFGAPGSFMVATENSYVGDLINQVGGKNIIENQEASFIPVDMEYLAGKNPDIILTMTHAEPEESKKMFDEEFATNQVWQHFDAVKEDKVYNLPNSYFGMSANLLALNAMETLVDMLYE